MRFGVALDDVLEVADAARKVGAIGRPFVEARPIVVIGLERIDRLEQERDREQRVHRHHAAFDLAFHW